MTWHLGTIGGRVVESDEVENKTEQIGSKPKSLKTMSSVKRRVIQSVLWFEEHASVQVRLWSYTDKNYIVP